jgi:group I intron endonuclease
MKNDKVYVGQTTHGLAKRKAQHKYMSIKKDRRTIFQIALLDEGFDSFAWEQIDTADTQEELDRKEKEWITKYNSANIEYGYNSQVGGKVLVGKDNPFFGKHHSGESTEKNRRAHLGKVPWNKGVPMSEEQKEKVSKNRKGKMTGSKHHHAKINEQTAKAVIEDINRGIKSKITLKKYKDNGLTFHIYHDIKRGRTWGFLNASA